MALETHHGQIVVPNTGTPPVQRTVTGLAFQPKLVLFYCACAASFDSTLTGIMSCFGAARTTGEQFTIAIASDGSGTASNSGRIARYGTECICLPLNGTPAIDALATFVQFNSDGFQVNFTDLAATASMEVNYLALGGSDLTNVGIQQITPVGTTNNQTQAVTFGFMPDAVIVASAAVPSTTGIVDAQLNIGAAVRLPSTSQYSALWYENDGAGNMDCLVYSTTQRCAATANGTAIRDSEFSIQSWDATGVTIIWNDAPAATTTRHYMIALKGGQYELENILAPTSAQSVTYTTSSITPKALLAFGTTDATDTDTTVSAGTVDSVLALGACDSGLRQGAASIIQQDANANSQAKRQQSKTTFQRWLTGTTGTLAASATVTALNASGFDLNWTTATAGTRRFSALVMGEQQVAATSLVWEARRNRERRPRQSTNPGLYSGR
jgi:hypothetical protein